MNWEEYLKENGSIEWKAKLELVEMTPQEMFVLYYMFYELEFFN